MILPVTRKMITSPRRVGPIPKVATIYYQKHPVSNNKNETCKLTGKYEPHIRKKTKAKISNRNCENNQISDLIEKDFKVAIICSKTKENHD